ncbi:sensor histidine kinase [Hymenobacter mucosus]|uniref:histidine kinase n=1 Tax=Hymenobacter mucosus TaxID=1411120 RepID=A0A238YVZ4_9BACT|nr:HAMP domain-containing sensor histidine kinase [Hymenobacter mucosus]SNR74968.1 two-component system, OmpR family, sensor histidine kinase VicK [Hymenobacter mucosus]
MFDFATLFRPLAEKSQQLYFVYHVEAQRLVYLSPAYNDVLGLPNETANEDLPRLVARIHPDDQQYAALRFRHVLQGRFVEDVELRLSPANDPAGPPQWLCFTAHLVAQEPELTYVSGTVQNITQSREYIDNADRYNKKKNTVLEILSHDLAGPFIMLKQVAGYVGGRVESLQDAKLNELINVMQTTCQESVNLIRDFVDTEFLESANVQLKLDRVDVAAELREMTQQLQEAEENLNLSFQFEGPTTCYFHLDRNKIMQVVNNLFSNAIKFTPDGGTIRLRLDEQPTQLIITLTDNGVGIPAQHQSVLFERFTPARRPGLRGEKTTGLGMSIIKTIVELHQGQIQVKSELEKGTTFTITLPRHD